jgi:flavin-dependent dehydrogenase
VLVIERAPQPGRCLRTTGLLVKEAAEALDVPAALTRRIEGVRLYAPSLQHVDLHAPGYYFLATDTAGLYCWMAERARAAGADLRFGHAFLPPLPWGKAFVLPELDASVDYIVGADGPRSRVARHFRLGRNHDFLNGIEAHYQGVAMPVDMLHCFLDSQVAPSYIGWAFQGVGGVVQAGVACRRPQRPRLRELLDRVGRVIDFSDASLAELRGGIIPVGGRGTPFHAERVALAGDAAGVVSPLTAGGIHTAIDSGRAVGLALAQCAAEDRPFDPLAVAHAYPRFYWKRKLRALMDRRPPDFMLELAVAHPLARRVAELIYFHRRGLGSVAGWRALFGPRAAPSAPLMPPASDPRLAGR